MLNPYQNNLIDALPDEGGLFYLRNGQKLVYDQGEAMELAMLPLQGKVASGTKRVVILHGAPGSGKTHSGFSKLEKELGDDPRRVKDWAIISYDEHGAIFDIPEYIHRIRDIAMVEDDFNFGLNRGTLDARAQAWLDYQPLSQWIRSQTLKHALKDELSLYIDTTSSSAGVLKLIDLLRDLDYTDVQVWSYQGSLKVADARIHNRLRPTSMDDLLKKRVGAMEMLPQLIKYADRVEMFENGSNHLAPAKIAVFEAGNLIKGNPQVLGSTLAMAEFETDQFRAMAAEHYGRMERENLTMRYKKALEALNELALPLLDSQLARVQRYHANEY